MSADMTRKCPTAEQGSATKTNELLQIRKTLRVSITSVTEP